MPALLVASLLLAAASAQARRPATAADVTDAVRDLDRAVKIAVCGTTQAENASRVVYLLLDATPSLKSSGFLDALSRALARGRAEIANTRIGLAALGTARPLVAPTTDHALVLESARRLIESAKGNEIRNVYGSVRRLAPVVKGAEQRDIVLVTFENGDAEDSIESTAAQLAANRVRFTAIVRESFLSDSYWIKRRSYWHDTRRIRLPKGCELIGGDGPFIDLPWGWVFQQTVVNEVVPSGFGAFGITRLAAASGGHVFLYAPPAATRHRCAVYGVCLFCDGNHVAEEEAYASFKLAEVAPLAVSRKEAYRTIASDPYSRAVLAAWQAAAKAGVLQTTPAVQIEGTTARADRNRGGAYLGFWDSLSFDRHARRAEEAAAACSGIIRDLEASLRAADKRGPARAPGAGRQQAIAALTRVYLYLARANLVGFAGWCREIAPGLADEKRAAPPPPEVPELPAGQPVLRVTYHNMCLCHGVRPFLRVRLPGGKAFRKELLMLDHVATDFMRRYGTTPFAVALHRAGIARFGLVPGGRPPRVRLSSKTKQGPVTGGTERGRPVRNPGATTGGTVSGPTTGRRP